MGTPTALFISVCFALCAVSYGATKPHILFVVIDDLGFDDVGFRSHQINTPTVDSLAAEGVILDQYYVQDVCSPTRSTFLSGRYPLHTGINDWIHPASSFGLPLSINTTADILKDAGYDTHAIGKWHLGFHKWDYTPTFRGFNSFYGFYTGGEDYFKHTSSGFYDFRDDKSSRCGEGCSRVASEASGQYSTTLFSERAVSVIENHDPETPLYMYLAYQAVHAPAEVPQSYVDPYINKIQDKKRRTFAGMLSCMDEGLGNVTAMLKKKGMWENTLTVFTTDNGGPTTTGDGVGARNWPLRGGKHSIWEGGTRGTAVVHGKMLKNTPYTNENLMHSVDWLPTLSNLVGGKTPTDLDGVDQWDSIANKGKSVRNEILYGIDDDPMANRGIRVGKWKLLQQSGGTPDTWYAPVNLTAPLYALNPLLQCQTASGVCFNEKALDTISSSTETLCCDACMKNTACNAWTLHLDTSKCNLFGSVANTHRIYGYCTSGSGHASLPQLNVQLYDLSVDPTEHHDVAASNPDVVKSLLARLQEIDATGVPTGHNDPKCGKPVHPTDPVVGKVWAPWC